MSYSDWIHPQVHWFADSRFHVRTCLLRAVVIPNHTLGVNRKIWGYEPSAWWDCMIKPDFCLINGELKPLNALRNVWLTDCILNQYVKLTLSLLRASCYTQDWWSDIDLRTKKTVKECLNRLIQYCHSSLRQTFWLVCHEVELPLNSCIIIPYEVNQISFDGFSTLIAERFSS